MSGLETKFPGKVTARNVDATEPAARVAVRQLGFKTHGLVVRDPQGAPLFKQPDHKVHIGTVETALREILDVPRPQT